MTTSDLTLLPHGAKERVAALVGTAIDGAETGSAETGSAETGSAKTGSAETGSAKTGSAETGSARIRIGIACAEFNGGITHRLLGGTLAALTKGGCDLGAVTVAWAPGAFELPLVARAFTQSGAIDAVICLGAVIRGDTGHYDFVAGQCAAGLQRVQLDSGVPVIFGVLTTDTVEQALVRSEDDEMNKGREAASTAIEMVRLVGLLAGGPLPELGD